MSRFNLRTSIKHIQIDKANTLTMIAVAATVSILVFSMVTIKSLLVQRSYQSKVISLRSKANKQLKANVKETKMLDISFRAFEETPESVVGTSDKNSKIVLDSLPSKYDFPALATSLEWVILSSGNKITGITGTDNEIEATQDSTNPQPIEIPFQISATGNFESVKKLISSLELSIRPIKILNINISGNDAELKINISAVTYYQPEKKLNVESKVIPNSSATKTTVKVTKATK
ncbi:MAG: type 4a pilus biogenesis protein PilO [Candidatus Saccharibacteria bacterium]